MDMGIWLNNLCFSLVSSKVKFHVLVLLSSFSSVDPPTGPVELGRLPNALAVLIISKDCPDTNLLNDSNNSASLGFILGKFSGMSVTSG